MSRNSREFACAPQDVFDVLKDGWNYAIWVVGASRIRDVEANWPEPGSRIHHSVGLWPLMLNDHTEVEQIEEPRYLQLLARAWPSGEGRVQITIEPAVSGCVVTIEEEAVSGPAKFIPAPLADSMLRARNTEALKRLAYLAEGRAAPSG